MSSTSRAANRLVLALAGLLLLTAGLVVLGVAVPATAGPVASAVDGVRGGLQELVTTVGSPTVHAVGAAVAVVVALLCLVLAFSRGGGRTGTALRDADGEQPGSVELGVGLVRDVLRAGLAGRPEISGLSVSAWRRRGRTGWQVLVRTPAGTPPRTVVDLVGAQVELLDAQLGRRVPVLVEVTRGPGAARVPLA